MAMTFKPVGFRVLVEQRKRDDLGILVPEAADDFGFYRRVVVEVGQAHVAANGREVPIPVKVGDEVMVAMDNPQRFTCVPALWSGQDRSLAIIDVECIKCVCEGKPDAVTGKIVAAKRLPADKVLVH